jgi:hypothetical protein
VPTEVWDILSAIALPSEVRLRIRNSSQLQGMGDRVPFLHPSSGILGKSCRNYAGIPYAGERPRGYVSTQGEATKFLGHLS